VAETIIPIDIATLLKSGIQTAMANVSITNPAGEVQTVTYRFEGVRDDADKWSDDIALPCIACRVHEARNHDGAQASRLRDYPVTIIVATHHPDDPWQIGLYTVSQKVGQYILGPATLSMSAATFRRISLPNAPQRSDEGRVQMIVWDCIVGVLTSA
jgi:hypothetical protein